ncbi:ABC transporter permease [Planctomycetota bacterium]
MTGTESDHQGKAGTGGYAVAQVSQQLKLPTILNRDTVKTLWPQWTRIVETSTGTIELDAQSVKECDSAGLGLLSHLQHAGQRHHVVVKVVHASGTLQQLWQRLESQPDQLPRSQGSQNDLVTVIGRTSYALARDLYELLAFGGRLAWITVHLLTHPRRFRWADFLDLVEMVGVRAVGLIALLGLLFGLIMGFSSAMPLRQFGVEIYVADLVAYAMVRVLGPFITAVIVAGRSGSAFAAEIGTMKIRNELDALQVMNLDPGVFLVAPRVLATILMTPLLAFVANVAGIIGCGVVILSLGYPLVSYWSHVEAILTATDVWVGLFKAMVFGLLVGAVGCWRGLQTESGPGAVGESTTRAVVTAIVMLIIMEGIFSVLLYVLEL